MSAPTYSINIEEIIDEMFFWWLNPTSKKVDIVKVADKAVAQGQPSIDAYRIFDKFELADRFVRHVQGVPDEFTDISKTERVLLGKLVKALSIELEPYLVQGGAPINNNRLTELAKTLLRDPNVQSDIRLAVEFARPELPIKRYAKKTILQALDMASLRVEGMPRTELGQQVRQISLALKRKKPGASQDLAQRQTYFPADDNYSSR